jgi:hypothetical protein
MDKALIALQVIDWQKVEKELNTAAGNVDIKQLQNEIKKAFKEIDWKKINIETEKALQETSKELVEEQALMRIQLERYNQVRQEKQEKINQVQYRILMDRLSENEKNSTCDQEKPVNQQKNVKKKKIVII